MSELKKNLTYNYEVFFLSQRYIWLFKLPFEGHVLGCYD